MNSTSDRIASLSPRARALLEARLRASKDAEPEAGAVEAGAAEAGAAPPTSAQARYLAWNREHPESRLYEIERVLELEGPLDRERLEKALAGVVRRHPILGAGGSAPALQLVASLQEAAGPPLDLAAEGPLRARLVALEPERHLLLLRFHHSVADCWSVGIPCVSGAWLPGVFFRELAALYADPTALPGQAPAFRDYAAWEADQDFEPELGFWTRTLVGLPPPELPADHLRKERPSFEGRRPPVRLDRDLVHGLAERCQATPFAVLLAAWAAAVGSWTGQPEVAVGTPAPNRERFPDVVGPLANMVTLRLPVGDGPGFRELAQRARRVTLEALDNRAVPLERVVSALGLDWYRPHHPLFRVRLVLHLAGEALPVFPGLVVRPRPAGHTPAKYDLTLMLTDDGEELAGYLESACDLLDAETASRVLERTRALLESAARDPEVRVA